MSDQRLALIVAVDQYEDPELRRLTAPGADADSLVEVLGAPELGGFDVDVLRNASSWAISQRVDELLANRKPSDLVLLHFSCHGLKDDSGQLYLAAANTAPGRLASTAVEATWISRLMQRSRAQRIVLLLDCCYGGAFERGVIARASGDVDVGDQFRQGPAGEGRGRAVITASTAMEYAFEGPGLADGAASPSAFTGAVVAGIRTGEADRNQDGRISLDELYEYVYDQVRRRSPQQTPSKWEFGTRGDLYVARNPQRRITPGRLPQELLDLMEHPTATARLAAVDELAGLARGTNLPRAAAARLALGQFVDDDSHRVSVSAAEALQRTEVRLTTSTADFGTVPLGRETLIVAIGVEGGPLALASSVTTTDSAVSARIDADRLRVAWIPEKLGSVDAMVTLAGPAGTASLHVVGQAAEGRRRPDELVQEGPPSPAETPVREPQPPAAPAIDTSTLSDQWASDIRRPRDLKAYFDDGRVAEERGDWAGAVSAFERVVAVDPRYRDAIARLDHARAAKRQLTSADRRWRWLHSIWILGPLLGCGFVTWASFLYIGIRARHRPWIMAAALYAIAAVFILAVIQTSKDNRRPIDAVASILLVLTWAGGFVHALIVNGQYQKVIGSRDT